MEGSRGGGSVDHLALRTIEEEEGQRVASHSFEVRVPVPERMTAADVYREAMDAVASVTAQGPRGEPIGQGIVTALDKDHLLTSFSTIEGATRLDVMRRF